jgi:hypothetical protein
MAGADLLFATLMMGFQPLNQKMLILKREMTLVYTSFVYMKTTITRLPLRQTILRPRGEQQIVELTSKKKERQWQKARVEHQLLRRQLLTERTVRPQKSVQKFLML